MYFMSQKLSIFPTVKSPKVLRRMWPVNPIRVHICHDKLVIRPTKYLPTINCWQVLLVHRKKDPKYKCTYHLLCRLTKPEPKSNIPVGRSDWIVNIDLHIIPKRFTCTNVSSALVSAIWRNWSRRISLSSCTTSMLSGFCVQKGTTMTFCKDDPMPLTTCLSFPKWSWIFML